MSFAPFDTFYAYLRGINPAITEAVAREAFDIIDAFLARWARK